VSWIGPGHVAGLNRALSFSRAPLGQQAKVSKPAAALPSWVKKGNTLVYLSKSKRGGSHRVIVKAVEEPKQAVLIFFEQDQKVWKRVPFSEISCMEDSTLRPVWKQAQPAAQGPQPMVAAPAVGCENKSANVDVLDDDDVAEVNVFGPMPAAPTQSEEGDAAQLATCQMKPDNVEAQSPQVVAEIEANKTTTDQAQCAQVEPTIAEEDKLADDTSGIQEDSADNGVTCASEEEYEMAVCDPYLIDCDLEKPGSDLECAGCGSDNEGAANTARSRSRSPRVVLH